MTFGSASVDGVGLREESEQTKHESPLLPLEEGIGILHRTAGRKRPRLDKNRTSETGKALTDPVPLEITTWEEAIYRVSFEVANHQGEARDL